MPVLNRKSTIEQLIGYAQAARARHDYSESTYRFSVAALNAFRDYLNKEESESLFVLRQNLVRIEGVILKAANGPHPTTLSRYRKQIARLIDSVIGTLPSLSDTLRPFSNYQEQISQFLKGLEPSMKVADMAAQTIKPLTAMSTLASSFSPPAIPIAPSPSSKPSVQMNKSEVTLREGVRVVLEFPADLTKVEAERLKAYVDLMVGPS